LDFKIEPTVIAFFQIEQPTVIAFFQIEPKEILFVPRRLISYYLSYMTKAIYSTMPSGCINTIWEYSRTMG